MASWSEIEAAAPAFAAAVRTRLDAYRHKYLATLRADGSPRISGIEADIRDGELWLGMMPGSVKARDVLRDPRLALHSGSPDPDDDDPGAWTGDAKLAGRAVESTDPAVVDAFRDAPDQEVHLFRVDLTEVVLTHLDDPPEALVIESWHPGRGLTRTQRR
jgi:hypothetical protein